MSIRAVFSIIFVVLIIAIAVCMVVSYHSKKENSWQVAMVLCSLLPPMIGNLLIICFESRTPALIGYYMYYIGIDLTAYALLVYTFSYCKLSLKHTWPKHLVRILFIADICQLLANIFTGHAFGIEEIDLFGPYYRMIPYLAQNLHRLLVYATLALVLGIFIWKTLHSSRIHARRYAAILITLLVVILWCTYYVVLRVPLDRSMIGYAVFGLLIFYFSLYYKPTRLMDKILVDISSEMPDALFFFDDVGTVIWANNEARKLANIRDEKQIGDVREKLEPFLSAGSEEQDNWKAKLTLGDNEEKRYYTLGYQTIRDKKNRIDGSFLSVHDDTQMQMELQKETYNARHDDLTDLYSKSYLYELIAQKLAAAGPEERYNIVFINVRNFKLINDNFGKEFGDLVLTTMADFLRTHARPGSLYGRMEADTFGLLVPLGVYDKKEVETLLAEFVVDNGELNYRVLIQMGVFEVTDPAMEISVMFDRARMALADAKNDYTSHIFVYDDETRKAMLWEQQICAELPKALKERQIMPYLQPLVDTNQQVVGAEALVRWIHPELGFLSPASFIPIFEKNGIIVEIDRHMWRCSCELLAEWKDATKFISINISPKDFFFLDVAKELKSLVREFGIDPARLRVEITETVMMSDIDNRVRILQELQEAGFIIELDDFGSGYSSLNMLKDMPIDVIKIDMAFLRKTEESVKSMKILRNIVRMSNDLNIVPLTEGVETEPQYQFLSGIGCKLFQGYYFAKPMPAAQFTEQYIVSA